MSDWISILFLRAGLIAAVTGVDTKVSIGTYSHANSARISVSDHAIGGDAAATAITIEEIVATLALQAGGKRRANDTSRVALGADIDSHIVKVVLRRAGEHASVVRCKSTIGNGAFPYAEIGGQVGEHSSGTVAYRLAAVGVGVREETTRTRKKTGPVTGVVVVKLLGRAHQEASARHWIGVRERRASLATSGC